MLVRVLGDLEVVVAGEAADLGGRKPRALVGLLVAAESRPVPVEQLIDQVWGEDPPARVEASLQSYVARLRRVLEPDRDPRSPARRLRTHAGGYSLDLPADAVDARRFAALVRDARAATEQDPGAAIARLTEALALWQGEPYQGLDSPSLQAEATRLEEVRLGAVGDLWELRIARGEHVEAVAELEQLVRLHPLRERLWALLALALYRSARQGDALATLRRAREHLAEELGVDPGPELRQLEESILRQDPSLTAGPEEPPSSAPPSRPRRTSRPEEPVEGPRLFGRAEALAAASSALEDVADAGRGRVVLVTGEAGIGKSRLTDELLATAADRGFRIGRGGWEAEATPPLWGWSRALRQLLGAGGTTEVLGAGGDADAASASFRQADAFLDALRGGQPTLLVLDDVHWADTESARLLRRVAADVTEVPLVLVLALRSAPAEITEPVAELLGALARTDPVRVELGGLAPEAIAAWVGEQTGREVADGVAQELARRTDGNPFYVTELVRLLVSEGALADPGDAAWESVPGGVRDVVRHRLAHLSDHAVDLLRLAAVAGRSFDVAVVVRAAGADEAAVDDAVEAAQVRGLVEEEAPGRFRFTHALVRDALYEAVSGPQRARAHGGVAAAIEVVHAGRVAEHASELAEHYRLAGPAHARSAWVFARRAAMSAAERSAYHEALRLYEDARGLQQVDPTAAAAEREDVLLGLARALTRTGRPVEAWAPVEAAARSALGRDDAAAAATALLTITDGTVWGWRIHPDYDDEAIALWQEVLTWPGHDDLTRAHLTAALAAEHLQRPGSADESTRLADEAIAAVRRSGGRGRRELDVLRLAQMALLRPDLLHHRMPLSDEIVERAAQLDHAPSLSSGLSARAQDHGQLGRLAQAHSDVVRSHELAERHHLSVNKMVTSWSLAVRSLLEEDLDAAERAIEENEAFQATLAMSGNGIGMVQLGMLRDHQGRLPELEPVLRGLRGFHPALRELHALAMARAGRLDELRELLGPWSEQPPLTWDFLWQFLAALRAQTWIALGDVAAATDLREVLTPYADRLAYTVPIGFLGSMRLTLGRLSGLLGDVDDARDQLEQSRQVHADLGLGYWVTVSEKELAAL
ncbi:MAG TPA: BTAD domain-containing putative transcriptional regulator [Nocardioides sp.]|nr:BTAD domain-containing putative transcriptional regulator [Nocardioides sp.]